MSHEQRIIVMRDDDELRQSGSSGVLPDLEFLAAAARVEIYDAPVLWLVGRNVVANARVRLLKPLEDARGSDLRMGRR
jgi:hypothetical protein